MIELLAQIDPGTATAAGSAATSILAGRSDAMVMLFMFLAMVGFYLYYVYVPEQKHRRETMNSALEIQKQQAETLGKLSEITTETNTNAKKNTTTLSAIFELKAIEIDCLRTVATQTGCDIDNQLSEMRGVIRAVQHGATDP